MRSFGMVGLVEDEEVDLGHGDEAAIETFQKNLRRTHHDHIFAELLIPVYLILHQAGCVARELCDRVLSEVTVEDSMLLNAKSYLFD